MTRISALLALVASSLGLLFASYSSFDYAKHLDRRLHDIHCSIIPGAAPTDAADACRAAMYSPYSALMKEKFWGGVPISLFAVGAFCFFLAFSLYLVVAGDRAPKKAVGFFALAVAAPVLASVLMFTISLTKLGTFCLVCVGIYVSSSLLGLAGLAGYIGVRGEIRAGGGVGGSPYDRPKDGYSAGVRPDVGWTHPPAWLVAMALFTLAPAVVYASAMPDHRPYLGNCGSLKIQQEAANALIHIKSARSTQQATLFEDPMCPTCKAFHQRMVAEDAFDKLDVSLSLFPLDSECNWMLTDPLHPGACLVARAVICGGAQSRQVLEWAYENQDELAKAGKADQEELAKARKAGQEELAKAGSRQMRAMISQRWGAGTLQCVDSQQTKATLNRHLHFAADNSIPVSTPQMYFNGKRFCDEDTDIGLRYTLAQIAPEVLK